VKESWPNRGPLPAFVWSDWRKPLKTLVEIYGVAIGIRTEHHANATLNNCSCTKPTGKVGGDDGKKISADYRAGPISSATASASKTRLRVMQRCRQGGQCCAYNFRMGYRTEMKLIIIFCNYSCISTPVSITLLIIICNISSDVIYKLEGWCNGTGLA
jgi:hypothetical protein